MQPLSRSPQRRVLWFYMMTLGVGKGKDGGKLGGWERDYDTPQLHFYLETFSQVFLAGHAFCFTDEQGLALFVSPAPLDDDEETDLN